MSTDLHPPGAVIIRLADVGLADDARVGAKAANLGELTLAGFPVPLGFVVTADAYLRSMDAAGIRQPLVEEARSVDGYDLRRLDAISNKLRHRVRVAGITRNVGRQILDAYERLSFAVGGDGDAVAVAVRSSAAGEDSAQASGAGMNQSYTNVCGPAELLRRVVDCWTSLYSSRAVAYRTGSHHAGEPAIAVVVQTMITTERAGVAFSIDPRTRDPRRLIIEAAFGLGEVVVGGLVEPDTYVVDRRGHAVITTHIGHQAFKVVGNASGPDHRVPLHERVGGKQVLRDDEVLAIAELVERIETHCGVPQDVEFAIDGHGTVFVVQSRPITNLTAGPAPPASINASFDATARIPIVQGLAAAPGRAAGRVRVLHTPGEGHLLMPGEVLVAPTTDPEWVPAIRRAAAIVTDNGGVTCHTAIISREFGLPAVVGARKATTKLRDGQSVIVDGTAGTVVEEPVSAFT